MSNYLATEFSSYLFSNATISGATLQPFDLFIPFQKAGRCTFEGTVFFEIGGLGAGVDFQFVQSAGGINAYSQRLVLWQTAVGVQNQNIDGLPSLFSNPGLTGTGYALEFSGMFFPNAACSLSLQIAENVAVASILIYEGSYINYRFF